MSLEAAKSDIAKLDQLRGQIGGLEREVSSLLPTASISATPKAESAALAEARRPSIVNDNVLHALPMYVRRSIAEQRRIPPNGYVLRGVRDGVAIVETRTGLRSVVPGVVLAGAGRVESIARRGRRWVVLTSQGLIDSDPY